MSALIMAGGLPVLTLVAMSCSSLPTEDSSFTQAKDGFASFKGLTRELGWNEPRATGRDVAVAKDPYMVPLPDGKMFDCRNIKTKTYRFNGRKYEKLQLDNDAALDCPNIRAFRANATWKVRKAQWEAQDESDFQAFVKQLGYGKCYNLDECLSSEDANMLISEEDMHNLYYSDCADFPYVVRAYFAYKRGLPFTFVSNIKQVPYTDAQLEQFAKERAKAVEAKGEAGGKSFDRKLADERYSANGNLPSARLSIPDAAGRTADFGRIRLIINDAVSSGTFRMLNGDPDRGNFGDFYSPQISPQTIRPGTPVYGTKGHVAIVYDVLPNGELKVFDAHPGNSISHGGWIEDEFIMDKTIHAGMFKKWRPFVVANPRYGSDGSIVKGQVQFAFDDELQDFSLEQYNSKNFVKNGKKIALKEWVQLRLSGGAYRIDPIYELKSAVEVVCGKLQLRVTDVEKAIADRAHLESHPNQMPENIYSSAGLWETHATPSRDLRMRNDTLRLFTDLQATLKRLKNKDPMVTYKGKNLKGDLLKAFQDAASSCKIHYTNSAGDQVPLTFLQVTKRMAAMSFDPYMCPERRWGATSKEELATCEDDSEKREWYKLTQFLRNMLEKDTDRDYSYTLQDLRSMDAKGKVDNNPKKINYDVSAMIQGL